MKKTILFCLALAITLALVSANPVESQDPQEGLEQASIEEPMDSG